MLFFFLAADQNDFFPSPRCARLAISLLFSRRSSFFSWPHIKSNLFPRRSLLFSRRSSFFSWPHIKSNIFPRRAARGSLSLSFFFSQELFFFLAADQIYFFSSPRCARLAISLFFFSQELFFFPVAADQIYFFPRRAARGSQSLSFFFSQELFFSWPQIQFFFPQIHFSSSSPRCARLASISILFYLTAALFFLSVALFSHTNMYHIIYSLRIP